MEIDQTLRNDQLKEDEYLSDFKEYRLYLVGDEEYIIAVDEKNYVHGCFEFHELEEGEKQLAHMYVCTKSQGKGIGKAIIQEAVKIWTSFKLPSTNMNDNYYYIEDGLGFIQDCFEKEILKSPTFKFPDHS